MKKIMYLCALGGSFIDQKGQYIRQDVMDTLRDFKTNQDDMIAMVTEGDSYYALRMAQKITQQQPDGKTPFDMLLHVDIFDAEKDTPRYWQALTQLHGEDCVFVLLEHRPDIRKIASFYGVAGIDMNLNIPSATIIKNLTETRQRIIQSPKFKL